MTKWRLVPVEPTEEMFDCWIEWGGKQMNYHEAIGRFNVGWKRILNAAPAPDVQPVAWQYKKEGGGIFASDQCPADIEVWNDIEWNKPLYTHPPAADVQELVEALKWIEKRCNEGLFEDGVLHQEHWKAAHDAGACARAYLKKREGK
jgi:hypothetical protein